MVKKNRGAFFQKVSIDLRTADTLVYDKDKGSIVVNESLVAAMRDESEKKVKAVDLDSRTAPSPS